MAFRSKLVLLLVTVAALPTALAGLLSSRANEREMRARTAEHQRQAAELVAEAIDDFLLDALSGLEQTLHLVRFERFLPAERAAALAIPYRQFGFVNIAALLDARGNQLAEPVFESQPQRLAGLEGHEPIQAADVSLFGRHIPLTAALRTGHAFGPVYIHPTSRLPRLALAIAFAADAGPAAGEPGRWVLACELSLREVRDRLNRLSGPSRGEAFVVDSQGRAVIHPDPQRQGAELAQLPVVAAGLAAAQPLTLGYTSADGRAMMATFVPVAGLGGGLVVAEPEEIAFAPARRIRTYTLFWMAVCLALALFGGIFFARSVSRPLIRLADGARELGAGQLDRRFEISSNDEVGQLAGALNAMAGALQVSFTTIAKQRDEIQGWNVELQQRVEARTRELRQAQAQIVRSQKMAAMAELSAGVAHEINNPLTGVVGFLQLLAKQTPPEEPKHKIIQAMLASSRRIQEVVSELLRLSTQGEQADHERVDLAGLLGEVVDLIRARAEEQRVEIVEQRPAERVWVMGDSGRLRQALVHLVDNALCALADGGRLKVSLVEVEQGAIRVVVADDGPGIEPQDLEKIFEPFYTKGSRFQGRGVGLAVVQRVADEHQGRVVVDSRPGQGATFELILPALRRELHLR